MADQPEFLHYGKKFADISEYTTHREWQESTYLGRLTLLLIKVGDNSFTNAIIDALSNQEGGDSSQARLLSLFANLGTLIIGICIAYALGRILQIFIGKEIVINQEVIIEEEIKLSDLKKALKENESREKGERRSAREKSKQS